MKIKFLRPAWAALIAMLLLPQALPAAFGQEGEPLIVDEVIAQINNDVITLSMLKRELKEALEARKQQGMSEQRATEEINRIRPEIIASLINEQLLLQKGKELEFSDEVEAEVNRRMLDVAKEQGIKTIADLDEALRQSGLDPAGIRQTLRTEIMKQMVLSREVDAKIFYGLTNDELQKYFNANRDKFRRPESVTLSEIFLSLAGKNEADVRAKATQLVAQARGGADFAALAAANSEREQNGVRVATQTKGKVGTFQVPDLRPDIAAAIKDVKAGGVSDPIHTNEGYQILRVDERTPGSDTPTFNENRVREAITAERSIKERTAYLESLRKDAYIKINNDYRATIEPLLNMGAKPSATTTTDGSTPPAANNSPAQKSNTNGDKQP
ncbi:MAG TPA: peptidyl-prolyl cis-trans isomerase [Pyrinomonadaceae bacterium]|nr:peptidyl-prolyl cis-trans isomerase [Pyrinomonadaceae bacterium]